MKKTFALAPIPESLFEGLKQRPQAIWVVTGCAGFIGVNIVENLLLAGQAVRGIDNLSTGHFRNLEDVQARLPSELWANFKFHHVDINDSAAMDAIIAGCDYVLHQAALGSVPRSIASPMASFESNVRGFAVVLDAARRAQVKRFVYASSSSVYGDHPDLPKVESKTGSVLSPYAATKVSNELFAAVFAKTYGMTAIGLRYFNVFGPRQDPDGAYAAVIPKWIAKLLKGESSLIYGDGETSRDFCFVANAVQANILAALSEQYDCPHQVFNVAVGQRTTLNELFLLISDLVKETGRNVGDVRPEYSDFRPGDVRHSLADISQIVEKLGYRPEQDLAQGLRIAMPWYLKSI